MCRKMFSFVNKRFVSCTTSDSTYTHTICILLHTRQQTYCYILIVSLHLNTNTFWRNSMWTTNRLQYIGILRWVKEIRYLGVYITQSRKFRCSLNHAKQSFHRSINVIFGKIGRTASEEVILELVKSKCLPILLYGLECFSLVIWNRWTLPSLVS